MVRRQEPVLSIAKSASNSAIQMHGNTAPKFSESSIELPVDSLRSSHLDSLKSAAKDKTDNEKMGKRGHRNKKNSSLNNQHSSSTASTSKSRKHSNLSKKEDATNQNGRYLL